MSTLNPDEDLFNWIYDTVVQIVKSPEFRNPLKDFIDDNCGSFIGVEENTFEQGAIHKEFITLADNLLETMTQEIGITEEMFCLAAKRGLEDQKENKKYFEQLIAFNNYNYFKNLMTKRNLHLEKIAYEEMMKDKQKESQAQPENKDNNVELQKLKEEQNKAEKGELECALKMSLALEEEAKKLKELEDAELEKAIKLSLLEQQKSSNPTPLIQSNPNLQIKLEPQKEEPKTPASQPEQKQEIKPEIPKKLNPIDKVALKQKQLKEYDERMKNIIQTKKIPTPVFSDKANESLNKKLEEMEANKEKTFQQYREMILKMKKEKRHQEEKEGGDILAFGMEEKEKDKNLPKMSPEELEKLKKKKLLAEQLKAKLKKK